MIERIQSIGEIERSFGVTDVVEASVKPRGFVAWCSLPYPKHPHGCPNFGLRADCPPNQPYFLDVYEPGVKVAYLKFDFEKYLNWRRNEHPNWTDRALRNPLYFQGHLISDLEKYLKIIEKEEKLDGFVPESNTEAMALNIHMTCKRAGLNLEWPPTKVMYRIRILARPKINAEY